MPGAAGGLQHALDRRRLQRPRPEALELTRRARQDDDDASLHLQHQAGRSARQPEGLGAFRNRRLLADAGLELLVGPAKPLREAADDTADLLLERRIDDELAPGNAGQRLHRTVVVGRAQPAGRDDETGAERLAKGPFQGIGPVADDEDALGLDPARAQLSGQKRPVLVRAPTADELAPGDEDDRCWAETSVQYGTRRQDAMVGCQARTQAAFISSDMDAAEDDAWRRAAQPGGSGPMLDRGLHQAGERTGMTRRAVITTAVVSPRPATSTMRPFTRSRRFAGRPMTTCIRRCAKRIVEPASSVPR